MKAPIAGELAHVIADARQRAAAKQNSIVIHDDPAESRAPVATFYGPEAARIEGLFGTTSIPTPFRSGADLFAVALAVAENNADDEGMQVFVARS